MKHSADSENHLPEFQDGVSNLDPLQKVSLPIVQLNLDVLYYTFKILHSHKRAVCVFIQPFKGRKNPHVSRVRKEKKKQLSHKNNFNCLRNVHVSIDTEVVFFKQFPDAKQEPRTEWLLSAVKVHTSKVCLGISEGMATKFYIIQYCIQYCDFWVCNESNQMKIYGKGIF